MDESQKRGTIGEAVFGLIVIFSVVIFLLYKFGHDTGSVANESATTTETVADATATLQGEFTNQNAESELYNKYLQQIYQAQTASNTDTSVDTIVQNYQTELNQNTTVPTQTVNLADVSATYDKKTYSQNFENLFQNLKANGGTGETEIINSQIVDKDTLIPLSDYDKENFVRTAKAYEQFANSLEQLKTPKIYSAKSIAIATGALNIAYILRQMAQENDQKIYAVWISKYTQNMFAIITLRYALTQ